VIRPDNCEDFVLPVKHRTQLDNTGGQGYRECFLTCCTMLADYLLEGALTQSAKARGLAEPEDAYAIAIAPFGDTVDWGAQIKALKWLGIEAYKSSTASLDDVAHSLCLGVPVVLGTDYGAGGHIILSVGRTPEGFHVLCPYGIRSGASDSWKMRFASESEARADHYSWRLLKQVFTDLGDEKGWALFVTAVNGEPTGVREGL
jgi:hypothetical protein